LVISLVPYFTFTIPVALGISDLTAAGVAIWALKSSLEDKNCREIIRKHWRGDGDILKIIFDGLEVSEIISGGEFSNEMWSRLKYLAKLKS